MINALHKRVQPAQPAALLIESDGCLSGIFSNWLGDIGFGLINASDYDESISQLKSVNPAIILLDADMLGGLAESIIEYNSMHVRATLILCSSDPLCCKDLVDLGLVDVFLQKPFTFAQLAEEIYGLKLGRPVHLDTAQALENLFSKAV